MPGDLFKTAPKEVLDYFDRRPSVPTFSWNDIAPREHALAYTVAKTAGFDIIEDLRTASREAVNYKPYEQFAAELEETLRAKGWWGRKIVTDPVTGKDRIVQLGSPRRLKTIYWGNVASAQAAGEWARTQATKDVLPYLEYLISLSERKRPEHMGWVGTTLPVDDSWWMTHYPPNGWHCKCRVQQISAPEAARRPDEKRQRPEVEYTDWKNKRTGDTEAVPVGIDPGWNHNPGILRDRTLSRGLNRALDQMPEPARRSAIHQLREHPVFNYVRTNQAGFNYMSRRDPVETGKGHFRAAVAELPEELALTLGAQSRVISLSVADAAKQLHKRPEVGHEVYVALQELLDTPAAVQLNGDAKVEIYGLISGKPWQAVIKRDRTGREIYLNSFHRIQERLFERIVGK